MPCYDSRVENDREEADKLEAVLCAMVRKFGTHGLDWDECGVSKAWFQQWWRAHQRRDARKMRAET